MRDHAIGILVLAIFVVACDKDPGTGPGDTQPIAVRVDGPTQMTAPAEVQFTAVQTLSDGSTRDVTARAQWTSSNPSVLSVSAGLAKALAGGEVGLTARVDPLISQLKSVRVVPSAPEWNGTYTLSVGGEACPGSMPIPIELRQRTYTVFIQQIGLSLNVSVQSVGAGLSGQIINPQARFAFPSFFGLAPSVEKVSVPETLGGEIRLASYRKVFYPAGPTGFIELLPNSESLVITGEAMTTMSPSGFVGTFNGVLRHYGASGRKLLGVCSSSSYGFSLVRQ